MEKQNREKENGATRWLVGDAFALYNRDVNYYRDKYLMLLMVFSFFWGTPYFFSFVPANVRLATVFCGISCACVLLAHRKLAVLLGGVVFLTFRGAVAFVYYHRLVHLLATCVCGLLALVIVKLINSRYTTTSFPDFVKNYTIAELMLDLIVFFSMLFGLLAISTSSIAK